MNGPYKVAQNLYDLDKYDNVEYVGFGEPDNEEGQDIVAELSGLHEFEMNFRLRQNIAPEEKSAESNTEEQPADATAEEGGAA